ncbi:MAG: hypothetical protein ACXVUL_01935 [Solirubrobacteraceae bacterium]
MSDLLERDLREAFADRAARITPEASARLRAVDYRPRSRRLASRRVLSAVGALGLSGAAATAGAVILLGSSAAPAFAGWTASPTAPLPGQLAAAQQGCSAGSGTPVLTDTRGPYTASIYADGSTCLQGNGIEISDGGGGNATASTPAGTIQLNGAGESDSDGHALTMVDGPVGAGVTGVTITQSDGSSIQATVKNGWYLAWWPGTQRAVTAQVASASGTSTQSFPSRPERPAPACPAGAHCASGYGFATGSTHRGGRSTIRIDRSNGDGK